MVVTTDADGPLDRSVGPVAVGDVLNDMMANLTVLDRAEITGPGPRTGSVDGQLRLDMGPVVPPPSDPESVLASFHPAVRIWFERRFPLGPTPPQQKGWPAIAAGKDTLIAAPTGSGKTLAGFLVCIDQLYRAHERGDDVAGRIHVAYVSPLKALGVDIAENLQRPLVEIREVAAEHGLDAPDITVAVRNGDTPSSERTAMLRRPPAFLVTTPESLYLLATAEKGRKVLASVGTVIVDEIHAVARDKRGSHLVLTLERLAHLCERRPVRVGLSATQRPIEAVARLLVGVPDPGFPDRAGPCEIVDTGHQRRLDLALELPEGELEAVASAEQTAEVLDRIAALVAEHHTTLVFVNTRRLAERIAFQLAERLGEDRVAAHHGSLSKDRRHRVETRLRAGDLSALVATASLELGIDVGPVELVCQIGSPRSLATFLQRVGRSGHTRAGTPKGRLYPLTRDELVECAGLLRGVRAGRLDVLEPPEAPLDILAQQIVAEVAAQNWSVDGLFDLFRQAAPFAGLSRDVFDEVLAQVTDGIVTGRGRRGAYVHHDKVNGTINGRRGARLAALTSGGAIPEVADYRVVADPDETFIGTVNEDWAIESMAGDIFLLGTTSWRIRRVEPGVVRVVDAAGAPPSVPFWLGEAPARTRELSEEVSELRREVAAHLDDRGAEAATAWLADSAGIDLAIAGMVVDYLRAGRAALGTMPTMDELVIERFFDDSGGMQLVVHSPYGGRINRGLGLALRKRFCKSFDFELQAAANDDAVVLSLGPQHSFPLDDVPRFLDSRSVEETLRQAVLDSPMFAARWRWNLNRSLVVLRFRGGRKNPPPIQRMEADDIMAAVFPGLAACQENVSGPIDIPDHPVVRQTMYDCLHEAMDIDGLRTIVEGFESGAIATHFRDNTEPSLFAHEILSARPYTFLDDAPLEERRTRAVQLRRGVPTDLTDIGRVDPEAVERVRAQAWPDPRDADEVHDVVTSLIVMPEHPPWAEHFAALVAGRRAGVLRLSDGRALWFTAERAQAVAALGLAGDFEIRPETVEVDTVDPDDVPTEVVRGHLDIRGPVNIEQLSAATGLAVGTVTIACAALEGQGFALRGAYTAPEAQEWCARRLLDRIHRATRNRLRREIEPVSAQDLMRFLLRWQHVAPGTKLDGPRSVLTIADQLQGFELAAGGWEQAVLRSRIERYQPEWLDRLCLSGEMAWARLTPRSESGCPTADPACTPPTRGMLPTRATPISIVLREDLEWLLQGVRAGQEPAPPGAGSLSAEILEALSGSGARFAADLAADLGRLPTEIEHGLWEGMARGMLTADGFCALRSILDPRQRRRRQERHGARRGLRRGAAGRHGADGRWSILPPAPPVTDPDELAEAVAEQLLARWGIVFRDIVARESFGLPWREIQWAMRRLEARGVIRGGRFVTGFSGEQYAHPDAVTRLRELRREPRTGERVTVCAADPLNLIGIIFPGPRVPAGTKRTITYVDGAPEPAST